jgi:hypothetical protein
MLGKVSILLNYFKALEVYIVKRYPTNKIPLAGLVTTYFLTLMFWRTYSRPFFLNDMPYLLGLKKEAQKVGQWKF